MKRLIITAVCALLVGLITGGAAGWFIGKESAETEPETTELNIIEQSLGDSFWSNSVAATEEISTNTQLDEAQTTAYGTHKYVLNNSSMKIHRSDCEYIKHIQQEHYAQTDDFMGSLTAGYSQCKNCYPCE